MKTVYFIRHGQSTGNASLKAQQGAHTLLTERGLEQAKTVARHMKKLPIQAIIASPFARTKATAEELGRELDLPIEYSELLVERRRPSIQLRKPKNHPRWLWAQFQLALLSRFSWYRHSDEETPEELLQRAHQALAFLAARPEDTIIVVTHGAFMRAMHAAMTFGEGITGRAYLASTRHLRTRNTALMIATYGPEGWDVRAWNADAATL